MVPVIKMEVSGYYSPYQSDVHKHRYFGARYYGNWRKGFEGL
jgi:hypothetical protein